MTRRLVTALIAVAILAIPTQATADTYTIDLPYEIIGGPTERLVYNGPAEGAGENCLLEFTAGNNVSPHNTDLRVVGNTTVTLANVERAAGAETKSTTPFTHSGTVQVIRVVHDEFSSLEGTLALTCEPPPTTTTTTTTTTEPPPTTTTTRPPGPPTIGIDLTVVCDNLDPVTGLLEQIVTNWTGTYTPGSTEFDVMITTESPLGTFHPELHPATLPSYGRHDNGFGYPLTGWVRAIAYIDGTEVDRSTVDCSDPTPPTTTPTTEPPSPPPTGPVAAGGGGTATLPDTDTGDYAAITIAAIAALALGGAFAYRTRKTDTD